MISYSYIKNFKLYENSQEDCYRAINKYALNIDIYTIEV
nr:MAG TPA: calcyclin-binding protein [Caudoviricetes sp.]